MRTDAGSKGAAAAARFLATLGAVAAMAAMAATPVFADGVATFDAAPASAMSYSESGVTFTSETGATLWFVPGPNLTKGVYSTNDFSTFSEIRGTIAGGASFVSVDLGDFNQDADTLFLEVFDAGNNSVGFTSQFVDGSFVGMRTLSLSASNISYAIFGARAPAAGGSTVFADNFTYRSSVAAVPEPGAYATGAVFAGTLLLGVVRGRRRRRGSLAGA